MIRHVRAWASERLSRKLFLALATTLLAISLVFLILLVGYYRMRLIAERATTSSEINGLLQVALENAMLKRDIDGLQNIVERLGEKPSIDSVMILTPSGEVRFAVPAALVGQQFDLTSASFCPGCNLSSHGNVATALIAGSGRPSVLRSVNPVANRAPCIQCHGEVATNPVNGILVIDYDADQIERDATTMAMALAGAGLLVLLGLSGAMGLVVQRAVLRPVQKLKRASLHLAEGRFDVDVASTGRDELAVLGQVFVGMSQRLAAQQLEIARREDFLQALIDAVPDGIRVIGRDYSLIKVNKAFRQLHGLAMQDPIATTCHATSHGRNEPCPATLVTCPLHELATRSGVVTYRQIHKRADGTDLPVEVSAATLDIVQNGTLQRCIVEAIRDLSGDIHHSHEQRLSEMGQLAAGVAHEIRNPLSSIHLTLQAMRRNPPAGSGTDFATDLNLMDGEIDRCIQVTDRLLRLSSPPADHPELVPMDVVIPEVVSLLRVEADRVRTAVTLDLEGSLRVVATDNDMRMLVLNIVQNGFHAMPGGGRLQINGRVQGDNVVLAFRDTGVGIAEKDMQRIFQPFWSRRADGAHGTGLGLSICREIVQRHGGKLEATSRLGEGSTFTVTLPWAEAAMDRT